MALDLNDAIVVVHVSRPPGGGAEVNKPTKYQLGPDVRDDEELYDSQERLIDDSYVDAAVEDAIAQARAAVAARRCPPPRSPRCCACNSRGSWTTPSVRRAAERSGASRSEWVRRALDDAANRASGQVRTDRCPSYRSAPGQDHRSGSATRWAAV